MACFHTPRRVTGILLIGIQTLIRVIGAADVATAQKLFFSSVDRHLFSTENDEKLFEGNLMVKKLNYNAIYLGDFTEDSHSELVAFNIDFDNDPLLLFAGKPLDYTEKKEGWAIFP